MFFVYLLKSLKSERSYVGFTEKDIHIRLKEHNQGGNKFTRTNKPFKLIYFESYHCKLDAAYREKFLKTGVGNRVVRAIMKEFDK